MPSDEAAPETQKSGETEQVAQGASLVTPEQITVPVVATTGKRQAFRDIRRQLQEAELSSPGVQKLLLEDLERAEAQCEILEAYVDRYYEADKRSAVLQEKLRTETAFEVLYSFGIGMGSAIIGVSPFFWEPSSIKGQLTLSIGLLLVIGSTIARIVKR